MDRASLDRWCERGILGLTLAILVFGPLAAGAVGALEFLTIQALTIGVVILWLVRMWVQDTHRLLWTPICWSVVAFTAYAIVRYQQAEIEYVARAELIRILIYAFLFLAVLNNLHRQESTQLITFALVFLGMAVSLYVVYQFFTNTPYVWHLLRPEIKPDQYLKRGSGTFICPNNLAGFLEMLVPVGLALTLKGRHSPTTRVFLGYASVAMLAGIGLSMSRGGWIATGAALVVLFGVLVCYRDSRLPSILFLGALLTLAVVFFKQGYQQQTRWQRIFRETGEVQDVRYYIGQSALKIWKQHFWWGVGPAHFDYVFPQYRPEFVQLRPGRVHNDYLNTLVDWGVAGAALVASAWLFLLGGTIKTWKFVQRAGDLVAKPSSRAAFVVGGTAGLLAILVHSLTDFNMHIPANAILAVTLMAMLTSHLRFASERYWVTTGWVTRSALTLVALLGLGYLSQQGLRHLREQVLLGRADRIERTVLKRSELWNETLKRAEGSENISGKEVDWTVLDALAAEIQQGVNEQVRLLKRAFEIEPMNFETSHKIGEVLRNLSWRQGDGREQLAREAMKWFAFGMSLNPHDAYNFFRYGMCLHLLKRRAEAAAYFDRARELDPRSYYVVAHVGWHYFDLEDYAEAKRWFLESKRLSAFDWHLNEIAWSYLRLIDSVK